MDETPDPSSQEPDSKRTSSGTRRKVRVKRKKMSNKALVASETIPEVAEKKSAKKESEAVNEASDDGTPKPKTTKTNRETLKVNESPVDNSVTRGSRTTFTSGGRNKVRVKRRVKRQSQSDKRKKEQEKKSNTGKKEDVSNKEGNKDCSDVDEDKEEKFRGKTQNEDGSAKQQGKREVPEKFEKKESKSLQWDDKNTRVINKVTEAEPEKFNMSDAPQHEESPLDKTKHYDEETPRKTPNNITDRSQSESENSTFKFFLAASEPKLRGSTPLITVEAEKRIAPLMSKIALALEVILIVFTFCLHAPYLAEHETTELHMGLWEFCRGTNQIKYKCYAWEYQNEKDMPIYLSKVMKIEIGRGLLITHHMLTSLMIVTLAVNLAVDSPVPCVAWMTATNAITKTIVLMLVLWVITAVFDYDMFKMGWAFYLGIGAFILHYLEIVIAYPIANMAAWGLAESQHFVDLSKKVNQSEEIRTVMNADYEDDEESETML